MSVLHETVPVNVSNDNGRQWSVEICGKDVPYWLLLVTVVVVVAIIWWLIKKSTTAKVKFNGATGLTTTTGGTVNQSLVNSDAVKRELKQLFEQF